LFNEYLKGRDLFVANNFTNKLNYKCIDQKERIKIVEDIINDNKIRIKNYFDDNFNVHPKAGIHGDNLSDKDKMCKQLETLATYILFCPDSKINEQSSKKITYNYYTNKDLERKINRDDHLEGIVENINKNTENKINTIDVLIPEGINYKKEIKQTINENDINDPELTPVHDYQNYINALKTKLDTLRKEKKNRKLQYKLMRHMKLCKTDQIICKDKLKGTIYFNDVLPDSTDIDYDQFDFFDKEHVKCLLKFKPMKLTTDLGILIYDLEQIMKHIKLNSQDKVILNYWRDDSLNQEEMSKILGLSQPYIVSVLDKIADRVTKKFEEIYEDWYYLNLVKGKYKKCSFCGKIKLANERYFDKDESKKDGFKYICKKCRKLNKNE
jgi:predicted XRE-type DNA-binding protein